jgi:hypothetical protein
MRRSAIALLSAGLLLAGGLVMGWSVTATANDEAEKVLICHFPPGNPANYKTLAIDADSVADHLAHGDSVGACDSNASADPMPPPVKKVTMCHMGKKTISAGANAVPAHLAHGDTLGACP